MSAPTALYRWRDCVGDLLYVGITTDLAARTASHSKTQSWWPQVAGCTVDWYDDAAEAIAAERQAILEENPRYNQAIPRRRAASFSRGSNRKRLELIFCDALLRKRTGQSYQQWAGTRRRGKMSWYQIALELAEVTEVESPSPYSLQRWYENPL